MFRAGKRSAQASAHLVLQGGFFMVIWSNRSVHGEGKWFAKFRTGKCW